MKRSGILANTVLLIVIIAVSMPIIWLLLTSFNAPREIISRGFEFSLSNYQTIFSPGSVIGIQLVNSVIIATLATLIAIVVASLAGYSLGCPGWSRTVTFVLLGLAFLLQLIPPMTLVPGIYVVLYQLGLLNTLTGLILLNVLFNLPFATLMLKIYFDSVPSSIREAGLVDGATEARVFWQLVLPLVKPGVAAVAIYVLIMAWNEFLMGLTLTTGGAEAPITVGIASLVQPQAITYGPMAAVGSLTVFPVIVLVIFANKQIVAGLTGGAVKG